MNEKVIFTNAEADEQDRQDREPVEKLLNGYVADAEEYWDGDEYRVGWETEYEDEDKTILVDDPVEELNEAFRDAGLPWEADWTGTGNGDEEDFVVRRKD